MLIVGTTFPISQILPMCAPNKELILNGKHYHKSRTLKLVSRQGITCPMCNETATHFQYHTTINSIFPAIRLMFEHVDRAGYPAFMTVDHIIPTYLGGSNTIDNLQISCNVCNSRKGHSLEYIPPTPHKKPNWRVKLIYIAYIRWYIRTYYHTTSVGTLLGPRSSVRSEIRRNLADIDPLDRVEFDIAWRDVVKSIGAEQQKQKVVDLFDMM